MRFSFVPIYEVTTPKKRPCISKKLAADLVERPQLPIQVEVAWQDSYLL